MEMNVEFQAVIDKAESAMCLNRHEEALEFFSQAITLDKSSSDAFLGLISTLRQLNRLDEAASAIDEATHLFPDDPRFVAERGLAVMAKGNYSEAVAAFDRVLATTPGDTKIIASKIRALRMQPDITTSEEAADNALEQFPGNSDLLTERGALYVVRGHFAEAVAAFKKAGNIDAVLNEAGQLEYVPARKLLDEALTLLPGNLSLLNGLGNLYRSRQRFRKALEIYNQILEVDPRNEKAFEGKIASLVAQKNFTLARSEVDAARAHYPGNSVFYDYSAKIHFEEKDFVLAVRDLVAAGADYHYLLTVEVWNRIEVGEYSAAETILREALGLLPDNYELLTLSIVLPIRSGKYRDAVEAYRKHAHSVELLEVMIWISDQNALAFLRSLREFEPDCIPVLNELGEQLLKMVRYEEAESTFDEVLDLEPENLDALRGKARSLMQRERFRAAEQVIENALLQYPGNAGLLSDHAVTAVRLNQPDKAAASFIEADDVYTFREEINRLLSSKSARATDKLIDAALKLEPKNIEFYKVCGMAYFKTCKYDKAIEVYDSILETDPDDEETLRVKSTVLRVMRRYAEADKVIIDALETYPDSYALLMERGWLYLDLKNFDKAMEFFDRVLELGFPSALRWKCVSLRLLRNFDEAARILGDRLEKYPNAPDLLLEQAQLHADQANNIMAKELFEKALVAYPNDLDIRNRYGWFLIAQNELEPAREQFERLLSEDEESVFGLNGLGAVFFNKGRYDIAEQYFRQALSLDPYEPVFYCNVAFAMSRLESSEKIDEAETYWKKALKIDPSYANALGGLGIIAFKRGDLRDAESFLLQSVKVDPREGNYADLGALYVQMGRYDEALFQLTKSLEVNQRDIQAHMELGNLYMRKGETQAALLELKQAVAIDPRSEDAVRALAIGLMQVDNFAEAEKVLRDAIRRNDERNRWQLHLTLSRILSGLGDKTRDCKFYEEANEEASRAILLRPDQPDTYFYRAIIRFKLEDLRGARHDFTQCFDLDKKNFEAERNIKRLKCLIREEWKRSRILDCGSIVILAASLVQLGLLWYFFKLNKIHETQLTFMVPILLGLTVLSFLLPGLRKLKLPGMEAELTQPKETISTGPTGSIGFGSSMPSISSGPK